MPSVGLRPHTVYGVGRDQGLTSAPTQAMLAAAAGLPFRIPYGGRSQFQYAPDVARAFVQAAFSGHDGASVLNLAGQVLTMQQVVEAIESAVPDSAGQVTFDDAHAAVSRGGRLRRAGADDRPGRRSCRSQDGVADAVDRFRRPARRRPPGRGVTRRGRGGVRRG